MQLNPTNQPSFVETYTISVIYVQPVFPTVKNAKKAHWAKVCRSSISAVLYDTDHNPLSPV